MPALFLTFVATAFALHASSESVLVARLAEQPGRARGLLAAAWLSSIMSSAISAWLGASLVASLSSQAKTIFAAIAFAVAAAELVLRYSPSRPKEPTRSLGAIFLVMFARELTDASRFLILALSVATGSPVMAAIGGALGTGCVLTLAWTMQERFEEMLAPPLVRKMTAAALLLVSMGLAISGLGLIG